jgi:hypothetical protein
MIIASAIKTPDGSVFVGKRHGDCYKNMKQILGMSEPDERSTRATQGFINDKLEFLTRVQAYHEAFSCGQCKERVYVDLGIEELHISKEEWKPWLASEDLW